MKPKLYFFLLKYFYNSMIRIRLVSSNHRMLDGCVEEVKNIALKMGLKYSGPVKLPTKEVIIPYKMLHKTAWDTIRMRLYRCLFNVDGDERFMRRLSMVDIPDVVFMSVRIE